MSRKGLYYTDTFLLIGKPSNTGVFNQVASIKENLTKYTKKSIKQADMKQNIAMFNDIRTKNLLNIIDNNMVKDLHITRQDIKLAERYMVPTYTH